MCERWIPPNSYKPPVRTEFIPLNLTSHALLSSRRSSPPQTAPNFYAVIDCFGKCHTDREIFYYAFNVYGSGLCTMGPTWPCSRFYNQLDENQVYCLNHELQCPVSKAIVGNDHVVAISGTKNLRYFNLHPKGGTTMMYSGHVHRYLLQIGIISRTIRWLTTCCRIDTMKKAPRNW